MTGIAIGPLPVSLNLRRAAGVLALVLAHTVETLRRAGR